ncbi:RNA polymerase sigma factor [Saccharopolyspora cebuensis]|uniref:RNA polymerase sigma factor n=1 Tax=Saccharopolyspora cebuensis TaxID=418759 RepID=A0ABV4CEZ2_9PSEU
MQPTDPEAGPPDAVLAAAIAGGDAVAFERLVTRYSGRVLAMALRMLDDRAEAEDVVQDVFLTVWHRVGELAEPGALRAWMFQIARRHCLIVLRRRRTRRTVPVDALPEHRAVVAGGAVPDPQRAAELGAGVGALGRALAGLPSGQRDVWLLAEVDGLSSGEIGRRVGAGEQAVRGRLSRARSQLADLMRAWR